MLKAHSTQLRVLLRGAVNVLALIVLVNSSASAGTDSLSKRRLGDAVNSFQPVVYPVLSFDSLTLFFSRKYHPDNIGSTKDPDDVWYSTRAPGGRWSEPQNAGATINTPESNVLCSISAASNTALLETTLLKNGERVHVFALTRFEKGQWTTPQPIHIDNYFNASPNFYAHLSPDESVLLLAMQAKGSLGGLDLYVCFRKGTSLDFTEPKNLGISINTARTEGSPCLAFDGKTLYFSSDGRGGFGNQDLFVTRRLDSTWVHWTEPENLGPAINTAGLDHCFSLSADGRKAYIVSSDTSNGAGVYEVEIPANARMGTSLFDKQESKHEQSALVDTATFEVYFETDKDTCTHRQLEAFRKAILSHFMIRPNTSDTHFDIHIDAYADSSGSTEHNQALSERRARFMTRILKGIDLGMRKLSIHSTAHGEQSLPNVNVGTQDEWKNRCVQVRFRYYSTAQKR